MTAPSGVIYGLIEPSTSEVVPLEALPSPFGDGPKPVAGAICAIELYSGNFEFAKTFVGENWGWGAIETMPQYMGFDTGAGFDGVFQ
ncbi:MAG: hypothetical protein M3R04_04485, partial [bacterium]|nr:hypothetical protein [bacterium]